MILCFDVALIVVKFLEPRCLGSFWRDQGLDWGMKFVYDGSDFPLYCEEVDVYFGVFSGIVLVGIGLFNNKFKEFGGKLNLGRVVRCGLYENNSYVEFTRCTNLGLLNYLVGVKSIVELKLVDFYILDMSILREFDGLTSLIIERDKRALSTYLNGVYKCKGLKCLKISKVLLVYNDLYNISKCKELVRFAFRGTVTCEYVCKLGCSKLEEFKLMDSNVGNLCIIGDCHRLRNVSIRNCDLLSDVGVLALCGELRSVMIDGCPLLREVDVLGGFNLLREKGVRVRCVD